VFITKYYKTINEAMIGGMCRTHGGAEEL